MRGPGSSKKEDNSINLHPTEIHTLTICMHDELRKKKCETIVARRISEIIRDYWSIVGSFKPDEKPSYAWDYAKSDLWQSMSNEGDIDIIFSCSVQYPLSRITQNMLLSDDWKEEFREKYQKKE